MSKPCSHFVEVAKELLPQMREWSEPLQVRIVGEVGVVLKMEFRKAALPAFNRPALIHNHEFDPSCPEMDVDGRRFGACLRPDPGTYYEVHKS